MKTYPRIRLSFHGLAFPHWPRPSAVMCATLLAPMGVAVQIPVDSSGVVTPDEATDGRETRLTFGAGTGSYGRTIHEQRTVFLGYDSCTGGDLNQTVDADFNFRDEFNDYGGELDVQLSKSAHLGIRGGHIDETVSYRGSSLDPAVIDTLFAGGASGDSSFSYNYFNPYFAVEKHRIGYGVGLVFSNNRLWTDEEPNLEDAFESSLYPTGHLRAGPLDKVYVKVSLWEGVPIYSGGGMWLTGIGIRPAKPVELFGGYSAGGPYSDGALLVRGNFDLGPNVILGANMRFGSDVDEERFNPGFKEMATSFSLTYRFHHN